MTRMASLQWTRQDVIRELWLRVCQASKFPEIVEYPEWMVGLFSTASKEFQIGVDFLRDGVALVTSEAASE